MFLETLGNEYLGHAYTRTQTESFVTRLKSLASKMTCMSLYVEMNR